MKISWYRNYDAEREIICGESGWEVNPTNLFEFMKSFEADRGWGNEAIEAGLYNAVKDIALKPDECGLS